MFNRYIPLKIMKVQKNVHISANADVLNLPRYLHKGGDVGRNMCGVQVSYPALGLAYRVTWVPKLRRNPIRVFHTLGLFGIRSTLW